MSIGPRQLPELRQRYKQFMEVEFARDPELSRFQMVREFTLYHLNKHPTLYFVDSETTEFLTHCAASLDPDTVLTLEDLPDTNGIFYFEDLPTHRPGYIKGITAFHWVTWGRDSFNKPEAPHTEINIGHWGVNNKYSTTSQVSLTLEDELRDPGFKQAFDKRMRELGQDPNNYADKRGVVGGDLVAPADLLLKAAFLLMQQDVVLKSRTVSVTDKKKRAQLKKAGCSGNHMRTRVISIRRHDSGAARKGTSNREYIHRWVVKGHWRNQWYPSRKMHRPVWVAPYMKGPDDAPLLAGEKVYTLRKAENDQL